MLGTALCKSGQAEYEVYGADMIQPQVTGSINFCTLDIAAQDKTIALIKKIKPDFVIHAAAYTDVDGCEADREKAFTINGLGSKNVALGCKETGARLFHMSTDFVFDGEKEEPYNEDDAPNPLSVYGASKLEAERAVAAVLDRCTVIRSSWLFGKHGKNFVEAILEKAGKAKEIKVVSDQSGSPTYAGDLASSIIRLMRCLIGKDQVCPICHIVNAGSASWYEYALEILEIAGCDGVNVIPITSNELGRPARRPGMSVLDTGLYAKLTGDSPRHYREALTEYLTERRDR